MIARHGWTFIEQFIIQHHFARFVSNKYHHPGPFYFYLPVLVVTGIALDSTARRGPDFRTAMELARRVGARPRASIRVRMVASSSGLLLFFRIQTRRLHPSGLAGELRCWWVSESPVSSFGRGEKVLRLTGTLLIVMVAAAIWYTHRTFRSETSDNCPGGAAVDRYWDGGGGATAVATVICL